MKRILSYRKCIQVGPVWIQTPSLTGATYKDLLEEILPDLLGDDLTEHTWYQQDGAPAHTADVVVAEPNTMFDGQWIGRRGPVNWPARSPDFNPMDFFVWDFVKEDIYKQERAVTPEELWEKIQDASEKITPEMIQATKQSFIKRMRCCLDQNGGHVENVL